MNLLDKSTTSFFKILFLSFFHANLAQIILETDFVFAINGKKHFTSRYCDVLTYKAKKFSAYNSNIDVVDSEAFRNCTQVTKIDLSWNKIRHLDEKIFESNGNLTELYLNCNLLTFISDKLLKPLTKLEYLDISVNPLGTIEPVLRSGLSNLVRLYIVRIELTQFNTSQVNESLPRLERINLDENFLACSTYQKMNISFQVNGIKMDNDKYADCSNHESPKCLDLNDFTISFFENQREKIQNDLENHINDIKTKNEASELLTQLEKDFSILRWILVTLMMCHVVALAIWLAKGSSFPN